MALDFYILLQLFVHKTMVQGFIFIGWNQLMEVPDVTSRTNLLVFILALQKYNVETNFPKSSYFSP